MTSSAVQSLAAVKSGWNQAISWVKRHPSAIAATAAGAAALGALAAFAQPALASCFREQAPICETVREVISPEPTLFAETPIRWIAEKTSLIGAPQASIVDTIRCVEAAPPLCRQALSALRDHVAAGVALIGGTLAAGAAMMGRKSDPEAVRRGREHEESVSLSKLPRSAHAASAASEERPGPFSAAPLADDEDDGFFAPATDLSAGASAADPASQDLFVSAPFPQMALRDPFFDEEREMKAALDAMESGRFGPYAQSIVTAEDLDRKGWQAVPGDSTPGGFAFREYNLIFIHLILKLQASGSYEEFLKTVNRYADEGFSKLFTRELYEAAKRADSSKLGEEIFVPIPFDQIEKVVAAFSQQVISEELDRDSRPFTESERNAADASIRSDVLKRYHQMANPLRALYMAYIFTHRSCPSQYVTHRQHALDDRSVTHQRIFKRFNEMDADSLKRELPDRGNWRKFDPRSPNDPLQVRLRAIAGARNFPHLTQDEKDGFLYNAAFHLHMEPVRQVLRSDAVSSFDGDALGNALLHASVDLSSATIEMILQQPRSIEIPNSFFLESFRYLSQTYGLPRVTDPEAQVRCLKLYESHPKYASIPVELRRRVLKDTIASFQPEGGRHPLVYSQLMGMLGRLDGAYQHLFTEE